MIHTLDEVTVDYIDSSDNCPDHYVAIVGHQAGAEWDTEYSADVPRSRITVTLFDEGEYLARVNLSGILWTEYDDGVEANEVTFDADTLDMIAAAIGDSDDVRLMADDMRAAAEDEAAEAIIADREWSADQPTRGRVWGE